MAASHQTVRKPARTVVPGDIVLLGPDPAGAWGKARLCRIVARSVRYVKNTSQYRVTLGGVDIFTGATHKHRYASIGSFGVIVPTLLEATMLLRSVVQVGLVAIDSAGETVADLTLTDVSGVQIPASMRQELIQAHSAGEGLSLCVKCYKGKKAVFAYVGENEHFLAQPTE